MEFHNYYRQIQKFSLVEFHDIDKVFALLYNTFSKSWCFTKKERENSMIIAFSGHSVVLFRDKIKQTVKEQIRNYAVKGEKIICYLGGYGDFDNICARACKELKEECPHIELVYITPYISLSEQAKIKAMQESGEYDSSIYPPIENVPPKFAISKRNEWMMASADLIIAYVEHNFGGAYKALKFAERKKKKIINICNLV